MLKDEFPAELTYKPASLSRWIALLRRFKSSRITKLLILRSFIEEVDEERCCQRHEGLHRVLTRP